MNTRYLNVLFCLALTGLGAISARAGWMQGDPPTITSWTQNRTKVHIGQSVTFTVTAEDYDLYGDPELALDTPLYFWWSSTYAPIQGGSGDYYSSKEIVSNSTTTITATFLTPGEQWVHCEVRDRTDVERNYDPDDKIDDFLDAVQVLPEVPGHEFTNLVRFKVEVVANCSPFECDCTGSVSDGAGPGAGGSKGPSGAFANDLETGSGGLSIGSTVTGTNLNGPQPDYDVSFSGDAANDEYNSPGLPLGWTDGYDYSIVGPASIDQEWNAVTLVGPGGGTRTLTPFGTGTTVNFAYQEGESFSVQGTKTTTPGQWASFTLTFKDGTKWGFTRPSTQGSGVERYVLNGINDSFGRGHTITRNAAGAVTEIRDAASPYTLLLTVGHDASGLANQVTDVLGSRKSVYGYQAFGGVTELRTISLPGGLNDTPAPRWRFNYETTGGTPRITAVYVPTPGTGLGETSSTTEYDAQGRVWKVTDANANKRVYTYDCMSPDTMPNSSTHYPATKVEVVSGTTVVRRWYQKWDPGTEKDAGVTVVDPNQTYPETSRRCTYKEYESTDPFRITGFTDAKGRYTNIWYTNETRTAGDPPVTVAVRVESTTTPRTTYTTSRVYEVAAAYPFGRLMQVELSDGTLNPPKPTVYGYDDAGSRPFLVTSVTGAAPHGSGMSEVTTSLVYDSTGFLTDVSAPGVDAITPNHTEYGYTGSPGYGRPTSVTNGIGKTTFLAYSGGRVSSVTDATGNQTLYYYNIAGQVEWVRSPVIGTGSARSTRGYVYAYPGGPLTRVNTYGLTVLLPTETTPTTPPMTYTLYSLGAEGEVLSAIRQSDPRPEAAVSFNAAYEVTTVTDGNARVTSYDYNVFGDMWRTRFPLANTNTHYDIIEYQNFDATGNPARRVDGRNQNTDYTYDAVDDQLTSVSYPGQSNAIQFAYDDPFGRRTKMTDPNGETTYTYDELSNPVTVTRTYKTGGSPLFATRLGYEYFPNGQRNGLDVNLDDYPVSSFNLATTYGYTVNAIGQLTNMNPASLGRTLSWVYDDAGRITRQNVANHSYTTYTHNSLGAIAQMYNRKYTNNALVSSHMGYGATDIGYDNLGNPSDFYRGGTLPGEKYLEFTAERNTLYSEYTEQTYDWWDFTHDNALNVTTMRGGTMPDYNWDNQFSYQQYWEHDGDGNAVYHDFASASYDHENQLTSYQMVQVITYGYDGDGLRAWKQIGSGARTYYLYDGETLLAELTPTGTLSAINTWGANGLVARWTPTSTAYYMYDNLGNVSDRLNASQAIVSSDLYDAYGMRQIGTSTDPYGYKGQYGYYTDRETGLILCTYRYYDPDSGRWLTRDPIGYDGGINLYGYVDGNPVGWSDPSGLEKFDVWEGLADTFDTGPQDSWIGLGLRFDAEDQSKKKKVPGQTDGPQDAYRHCIWSCLMTKEIGREDAKQIADNHEDAGNRAGGSLESRRMDEGNNAAGRASYPCKSCADTCYDKLIHGQLFGWDGAPLHYNPNNRLHWWPRPTAPKPRP